MRGHSVGGFGSVTTNKVIATIAGQVFGKDVQAYPKYGSEKKGLPTTYYLTIADSHIYTHSELEHVDLVCSTTRPPCSAAIRSTGMVAGGAIFMQSRLHEPGRRLAADSAAATRTRSATRSFRVYFTDMVQIAREVASRGRPADAHAGHRAAGRVSEADALRHDERHDATKQVYAGVEKALRKYFGKRGEQVVQDNLNCVKRGYSEMQEIPREIMHAETANVTRLTRRHDHGAGLRSDVVRRDRRSVIGRSVSVEDTVVDNYDQVQSCRPSNIRVR